LNDGLDKDYELGAIPAGKDPNAFAGDVTHAVAVFTDIKKTPTFVVQQTGPSGLLSEVLPFTDLVGHRPGAAEVWYEEEKVAAGGDGTVPTASSVGQFLADNRVTRRRISDEAKGESIDRTGMLSSKAGQKAILEEIGISFTDSEIATDQGLGA